jgi:hypothetical protein
VLPAHRTTSHLQKESGHPFRESLQFIVIAVMSVIGGTFPLPIMVLCDGELRVCSATVTSSSW